MAAAADMRYMQRMPKSTVERVRERRDKLRAAGLRPVQIWLPDTTAPGFADEAARQARSLTEWEASPTGRQEMAFWDALAAEAWDDEPD
jgi:antidote-toxin recognition MazE-like antitoxin